MAFTTIFMYEKLFIIIIAINFVLFTQFLQDIQEFIFATPNVLFLAEEKRVDSVYKG